MKYAEEFKSQWESLTNFIVSKMLMSNEQYGKVDVNELNNILKNEKLRWNLSGQYNQIWLSNLQSENADIGKAFVEELSRFQFTPEETPENKNAWFWQLGPTVGGVLVGYGVPTILNAPKLLVATATVVLGAAGLGTGRSISKQKHHETVDLVIEKYKQQLSAEGAKLEGIVSQI